MSEQPDWLEVGSTIYDCGECGTSFLDQVFAHADADNESTWLACSYCGWQSRMPNAVVDSGWYHQRYGIKP
jgi:DNA-directed RNA polymerase subunit RPC12/RpoP